MWLCSKKWIKNRKGHRPLHKSNKCFLGSYRVLQTLTNMRVGIKSKQFSEQNVLKVRALKGKSLTFLPRLNEFVLVWKSLSCFFSQVSAGDPSKPHLSSSNWPPEDEPYIVNLYSFMIVLFKHSSALQDSFVGTKKKRRSCKKTTAAYQSKLKAQRCTSNQFIKKQLKDKEKVQMQTIFRRNAVQPNGLLPLKKNVFHPYI